MHERCLLKRILSCSESGKRETSNMSFLCLTAKKQMISPHKETKKSHKCDYSWFTNFSSGVWEQLHGWYCFCSSKHDTMTTILTNYAPPCTHTYPQQPAGISFTRCRSFIWDAWFSVGSLFTQWLWTCHMFRWRCSQLFTATPPPDRFLQITERDFLLQAEMTQRDNLKQAVALPFMQKPKQMEHFHVNTSVVVELFFTRMKTQKPMWAVLF